MKPHDFDRLSAYIDNQLSPAEKADLEARLRADAELRAALQELRLTVRALRALPPVKPPRSFTLTPAQAAALGGARRGPAFPALRFAAALSALALAVVVAGDFASRGAMQGAPAPAGAGVTDNAATASTVVAEAPPEAAGAMPTPDPVAGSGAVDTDATAEESSTGGGEAAPTEAMTMLMAEATPTPTLAPRSEIMVATTEAEAAPKGEATETPPQAGEDAARVAALTPTPTTDPAMLYDTYSEDETRRPALPPLRVLEAALAVLTVLFGLGAWFARRA